MRKRFVLDTNILLHFPNAINGFEKNDVYLLGTTLEELDAKKTEFGEVGYHARETIRILEELRMKGDLIKGVKLTNGGRLIIEPDGVNPDNLPAGYSIAKPDNRIISACLTLNQSKRKSPVILVTEDVSMRINASVCGVQTESYHNTQIESSGYIGSETVMTDASVIAEIYDKHTIAPKGNYIENEFITLKDQESASSALTVYRGGNLNLIPDQSIGSVKPLNEMQQYTMWALMQPADKIPLVILIGAAGTAKTFLSLAAGLEGERRGLYSRMLISRPNAESYRNIGFLPGDLQEKLAPLYASYYDNLEMLLKGSKKTDPSEIRTKMETMMEDGTIEVCALDFIRGRSLADTYLICNEAQNASQSLIRDVITRAGRGTKIILAGDPDQIDAPTLDAHNNGLVFAAERMKGSPMAAVITFQPKHTVRSALSREASVRLKR